MASSLRASRKRTAVALMVLAALGGVGVWRGVCGQRHPATPSADDVALAKRVAEHEVTSLAPGEGEWATVRVRLDVLDPYIRKRLTAALKKGDADRYDDLLWMLGSASAAPYFAAAVQSRDPLLRSAGVNGLCRADPGRIDHYAAQGLADPEEIVRCEAVAALASVKGREALPQLRRLAGRAGLLEPLEVAAARIRLGDEEARPALDSGLSELRRKLRLGDPRRGPRDNLGLTDEQFDWALPRIAYYELVQADGDGNVSWDIPSGERSEEAKAEATADELEHFVPTLALVGEPYDYLKPVLRRSLQHPSAEVRGQVVRCLGRIPESWATELLRSRLSDDAVCALNFAGYGYHASVGCLAAICLAERGDRSGVPVLRAWVDGTRVLIRRKRIEPPDADDFDPNSYAMFRDMAAAVALARLGERSVKDVLQFALHSEMTVGPAESWETGPSWEAYHLALLGDRGSVSALRTVLQAPKGAWEAHWRGEAAACILALARGEAEPAVFAPAWVRAGPFLYPDCLSQWEAGSKRETGGRGGAGMGDQT